jgi:hypothetical protein
MYILNFLIELRIDGETAYILRKETVLPFVPSFGMNIETSHITLEINKLGYSIKDNAFFSILEEQNIDSEELENTIEYWKSSEFVEYDISDFKHKEATVG